MNRDIYARTFISLFLLAGAIVVAYVFIPVPASNLTSLQAPPLPQPTPRPTPKPTPVTQRRAKRQIKPPKRIAKKPATKTPQQIAQEKKDQQLFAAIEDGNISRVRQLLLADANVNAVTSNDIGGGQTPLVTAIELPRADIVQLLLQHGAIPRPFFSGAYHGMTSSPLQEAFGSYERDPDMNTIMALLQAGADVNERFEEGSPLASAAIAGGAGWHARRNHIRLMQALLRHGAKLESRDANGWTPLMYAASPQDNLFDDKPDFSACEVLLSHGANINAHDNLGRTALMHAIAAEPKIQNAHEFAWDENEDPSRQAEFNVRVMKFLLTHGADLNAHDNRGWTPLKLALAPMHSPFDTGGGHSSPPPWSLAAQQKRRLTAIQLLLSHGANVNVRDERGWTPLMGALQIYYEGNEPNPVIALAPIRLLLAHGANVNARAKDGTTALLLAHKEHDAEQVLRAAGAK